MADTSFDVDAMLDGALAGSPSAIDAKQAAENAEVKTVNSKKRTKSKSRSRSRSRDRKKGKRSASGDKKRSRSRSRSRDRRRKRSRSRSPLRRRSRSRDRRRSRSRSLGTRRRRSRSPLYRRPRVLDHRDRRHSPGRRSPPRGRLPGPERRDVMPFTARHSPPKNARTELTAEERDQRTLFIMQIARLTRPRDLEEFFSAVGNVRDVRIITDSRTGRSKGIAYVEFWEEESVPLGLALNGQKLLGAPLLIQRTCSERNRAANASAVSTLGFGPTINKGPCKLLIENLHPKITEDMLRDVFVTFGRMDKIDVPKDENGDGIGNASITYRNSEDATKAMEQLNNFDLAGKAIRVSIHDLEEQSIRQRSLDDMDDRQGLVSGSGGRMQLMAKLAQGTGGGMALPEQTKHAVEHANDPSIPAIATQCFMLTNMFDPLTESEPNWDEDVKEDVIEECMKHGGALHVYVDKGSEQGNVYIKCPSILAAHKSVTALHGRLFSGKVITANYVPVNSYHELFPDSTQARSVLSSRLQTQAAAAQHPPMGGMPPMPFAYGMPMMPPPPPMNGFGGFY